MLVKILDCTLRDGGYINNFNFGRNAIDAILTKLSNASIEIIECGFLSDATYIDSHTIFNDVCLLNNFNLKNDNNQLYVAMLALGEKEIHYKEIKPREKNILGGIRITFHENEIERAFEFASNLMEKGYKIFMQPVGTMSYTDDTLIKLIKKINTLNPYAFYIVDTLGTMYENDLLRLFYIIDHNLSGDINIGFHSHNNLQLSFSNAQILLKLHTKRTIIIDSSVFGMGRGAGNLCTELLTQYINDNIENRYNVLPLLEIVDEHLAPIYSKYTWGYSVPYYLAAVNKCHPNYASYLLNKQTITVKQINEILNRIPSNKRTIYNGSLIEDIYVTYQKNYIDDQSALFKIKNSLMNRMILILAPGKSIDTEKDKIRDFISLNNPCIIAVDFIPEELDSDFIFFSNAKRYNSAVQKRTAKLKELIVTSNILSKKEDGVLIVNYENLLNDVDGIADNAGLMIIKLLKNIGVSEIFLAGFDGYTLSRQDNFCQEQLINSSDVEDLICKGKLIQRVLKEYSEKVKLQLITTSIYTV